LNTTQPVPQFRRPFELQRLRRDHEAAVFDFERANRAHFAESISDRGDDFFQNFAERYSALLAEQKAGARLFHVLVDEHETVVGRFNLSDLKDGTAEVGYRVAQRVSGRGLATSGLRSLCRIASEEYGLRTLRAVASNENIASQRVLAKVGFVAIGPAEADGRQGTRYELALASL
jgi:RimJ/RimL family protein N-acetyltransferase